MALLEIRGVNKGFQAQRQIQVWIDAARAPGY